MCDLERPLRFVDSHPRVGWYIALVVTLNFLLEIGLLPRPFA